MSAARRYALDANVFIQAHHDYYAFDICPGFWNALIRQHEASRICSVDKIKPELLGRSDALSDWVKRRAPKTFFKETKDKKVISVYRDMANWAQSERQFTLAAKAKFLSAADGWLVAYAAVNGRVVVTHEGYAPDIKKDIPIPNVCIEFGVEYCGTFDLLRGLREQFVLKTRRRRR